MRIDKTWFQFVNEQIPEWWCPTCGKGVLSLDKAGLVKHESGESARLHDVEGFGPEWISYRFSAALVCANRRCQEIVMVVGNGSVEEKHYYDEFGEHHSDYPDIFFPQFFEPPLRPIDIPDHTPKDVKISLTEAFKFIFVNQSAATNQLRVAIEVLLDNFEVKRTNPDGTYRSLGNRLKILPHHLSNIFIHLSAIRWIGNAGSHELEAISITDLLDALKLIESMLNKLYPPIVEDIENLAQSIHLTKKPRSQQ
jgi:hypothetical protein